MGNAGLAVLASLLIAGCSDLGRPPSQQEVGLPDSADQVAYGFTRYVTIEGVERVQLDADSAFHYPAREQWRLHELRVTFRTAQGEIRSRLSARLGTYNWRTGDMVAQDSVVVTTPEGRRLTTCEIQYDEGADEITGPCAFEVTGPDERVTGDSFISDPDFHNYTVTSGAGTTREPIGRQ
jgi:LPS export ABC transporter protein LptC